MSILAVESSCDESALAIFDEHVGMLHQSIASQIEVQKEYGGVVPDLASREHLKNLPILLSRIIQEPFFKKVDRVAVTVGPGLAPALAMGITLAQGICVARNCPIIAVNHLRAHAFSPFISLFEQSPTEFKSCLSEYLPHLGLLVSGGNTILFCIDQSLKIQIIAQTIDDAAGEALDKGARLLNLGYPGGPLIEKYALLGKVLYPFPKAMQKELNFSFSGLKTALRYFLDKMSVDEINAKKSDICASYQQAIVDQLVYKTKKVLKYETIKSLGLSGGVANNKLLRDEFESLAKAWSKKLLSADLKYTGDNAGMIAFAAYIDPICQPKFELDIAVSPTLSIN